METHVWPSSFEPADTTLDTLEKLVEECRFGVFVFSPDDEIRFRGAKMKAVRDNVVWEHGLFSGKKGPKLTFIVKPGDVGNLKMPTDLLGVTTADYDSPRSHSNLVTLLRPACDKIAQNKENDRPQA